MIKSIKKILRHKSGQSVVELAITLPVLILVLCGIIDFGWIFSNKMLINFASREGARYGIVNSTAADAKTLIANKTKSAVPTFLKDKLVVTVTFSNVSDIRSGDVIVKVVGTIKALTPLTGIFTSDQNIILNSICTMKVE